MNLDEATALIRSLNLPMGDYAVFGSGPLLAHGIIDYVADIDMVSRGPAWEHGLEIGDLIHLTEHNVTVCSFFDGLATMGRSWAYGAFDVDDLINSAELIDGLPYVPLEFVISYKKIAGRPKDMDHLARYAAWLDSTKPSGH
jgi:hypothetical protein